MLLTVSVLGVRFLNKSDLVSLPSPCSFTVTFSEEQKAACCIHPTEECRQRQISLPGIIFERFASVWILFSCSVVWGPPELSPHIRICTADLSQRKGPSTHQSLGHCEDRSVAATRKVLGEKQLAPSGTSSLATSDPKTHPDTVNCKVLIGSPPVAARCVLPC